MKLFYHIKKLNKDVLKDYAGGVCLRDNPAKFNEWDIKSNLRKGV